MSAHIEGMENSLNLSDTRIDLLIRANPAVEDCGGEAIASFLKAVDIVSADVEFTDLLAA